jgi:hypothetical protein
MSAILAALIRFGPYVLCLVLGGYLTHRTIDVPRYDRLQTSFASYRGQVADENAKAQQAARDAIEAQIKARLKTEANNSAVIQQLQQERDSAAADRDFARRLLVAAQARSTATSGAMPQAGGGSGSNDPSGAPGGGSLAEDLAAAAGECRAAIQRLAALQAELAPQL